VVIRGRNDGVALVDAVRVALEAEDEDSMMKLDIEIKCHVGIPGLQRATAVAGWRNAQKRETAR
jgi:hypothetical protein